MNDLLEPLRRQKRKTGLSEYMVTFVIIWFIWNRQNVLSIIVDDVDKKHQAVTDLFDHEWWVWLLMVIIAYATMSVRILLIEVGEALVISIKHLGRWFKHKADKGAYVKRKEYEALHTKIKSLESEIQVFKHNTIQLNASINQLNLNNSGLQSEISNAKNIQEIYRLSLNYDKQTRAQDFINLFCDGRHDGERADFIRFGKATLYNNRLPDLRGYAAIEQIMLAGEYLFEGDQRLTPTGIITLSHFLVQEAVL